MAVLYPASFIFWGSIVTRRSMPLGDSMSLQSLFWLMCTASRPDINEDRVGEQYLYTSVVSARAHMRVWMRERWGEGGGGHECGLPTGSN
jgi:hypothetical protein